MQVMHEKIRIAPSSQASAQLPPSLSHIFTPSVAKQADLYPALVERRYCTRKMKFVHIAALLNVLSVGAFAPGFGRPSNLAFVVPTDVTAPTSRQVGLAGRVGWVELRATSTDADTMAGNKTVVAVADDVDEDDEEEEEAEAVAEPEAVAVSKAEVDVDDEDDDEDVDDVETEAKSAMDKETDDITADDVDDEKEEEEEEDDGKTSETVFPDHPDVFEGVVYDEEEGGEFVVLGKGTDGPKVKVLVADGIVTSFRNSDDVEYLSYDKFDDAGGIRCLSSDASMGKNAWSVKTRSDNSVTLQFTRPDDLKDEGDEEDVDCQLKVKLENNKLTVGLEINNTFPEAIELDTLIQCRLAISNFENLEFSTEMPAPEKGDEKDDADGDIVITEAYDSIVLPGKGVSHVLCNAMRCDVMRCNLMSSHVILCNILCWCMLVSILSPTHVLSVFVYLSLYLSFLCTCNHVALCYAANSPLRSRTPNSTRLSRSRILMAGVKLLSRTQSLNVAGVQSNCM
jgi:hypothetical protein